MRTLSKFLAASASLASFALAAIPRECLTISEQKVPVDENAVYFYITDADYENVDANSYPSSVEYCRDDTQLLSWQTYYGVYDALNDEIVEVASPVEHGTRPTPDGTTIICEKSDPLLVADGGVTAAIGGYDTDFGIKLVNFLTATPSVVGVGQNGQNTAARVNFSEENPFFGIVSRNIYNPVDDSLILDSISLITLNDRQCILDYQATLGGDPEPTTEPETAADIVITSEQTNPIESSSLQADEVLVISDDLGVIESLTSSYQATGFEICYSNSVVIFVQLRYGIYRESTGSISNVRYGSPHGTEPDEDGVDIFCDIRNTLVQEGGLKYIFVDQSPDLIRQISFITQSGSVFSYGQPNSASTTRSQIKFEPNTGVFGGFVSESIYNTGSGLTFLDSIAAHKYDETIMGPYLDQSSAERQEREATQQAERERLAAEEEERKRQEAEAQETPEEKAERERLEAEQAEQAEQERLAAEQAAQRRAEQEAEREARQQARQEALLLEQQRQEAEAARIAAAQQQREEEEARVQQEQISLLQRIELDANATVTSGNKTETGEGVIEETEEVTTESNDDDSGVSGGIIALIVILVIILIVVVLLYVFREKLALSEKWQSLKAKMCARKASKASRLNVDMDQSSRQPISKPLREQPTAQPNIDFVDRQIESQPKKSNEDLELARNVAALRANQDRGTTNSQVEEATGMEDSHIAGLNQKEPLPETSRNEHETLQEPRNNDTMQSSIPRDQQTHARQQFENVNSIAEVATPIQQETAKIEQAEPHMVSEPPQSRGQDSNQDPDLL